MKAETYSKPVQLGGTEAVLVRCGSAERLLTRVQRKTQRKAPEPPLAKPRRSSSGQAAGKAGAGEAERLNVLVLFIDSLGRRHFFRRMPRTAAALEAVARRDGSGLHQFFRYHVVGFHTDPNTHVMYTGSPFDNPSRARCCGAWVEGGGLVFAPEVCTCSCTALPCFASSLPTTSQPARRTEATSKFCVADGYLPFLLHHPCDAGAQPFWHAYRQAGYVSGSVYNL